MTHRILLIDDDKPLAGAVEHLLAKSGYEVLFAETACAARTILSGQAPTLVVLDLILPDEDGIELCREIRSNSDVPIIIMSCRTDHADRVTGLEAGADDYVTKPFSLAELLCRICNVLRRAGKDPGEQGDPPGSRGDHQRMGELTDMPRTATKGLSLTAAERRVLGELARRPGEVVSAVELGKALGRQGTARTRAAAEHISSIRKKLARAGVPDLIRTVRGFGYRMD